MSTGHWCGTGLKKARLTVRVSLARLLIRGIALGRTTSTTSILRRPHRPASPGHGTDLRDLEKQPRFGLIPPSDGGSCSTGQIRALMAESFCAKQVHCLSAVVHCHRLSLNAEEYSMVVILRMNRVPTGPKKRKEKRNGPPQIAALRVGQSRY